MSNQEAPFSYTLKVLSNLFTVRGGSADEMEKHLLEAQTLLPILIALTKQAQQAEQGADPVALVQTVFPGSTVIETAQPTPVAPAQPFAPVAPPASAAPTTPTGPVCKHGVMTYRTGTNKNTGAPWAGWFCPSPKGTPDQCSAQFGK